MAGQVPLNNELGRKTDHSKGQTQKQNKRAEFAGFGFPGQVTDDEQHVEHEAAHAEREPEAGNLLLCEAEHQRVSPDCDGLGGRT